MSLITRETDYAIRALCHMAQNPEQVVSVADLCSLFDLPRPFLRGILQTLARARILSSYRGKGGGFRLGKKPASIRLIDLIDIFQGTIDLTGCVFRGNICSNKGTCLLRKTIKRIEMQALKELRATTIETLAADAQPIVCT